MEAAAVAAEMQAADIPAFRNAVLLALSDKGTFNLNNAHWVNLYNNCGGDATNLVGLTRMELTSPPFVPALANRLIAAFAPAVAQAPPPGLPGSSHWMQLYVNPPLTCPLPTNVEELQSILTAPVPIPVLEFCYDGLTGDDHEMAPLLVKSTGEMAALFTAEVIQLKQLKDGTAPGSTEAYYSALVTTPQCEFFLHWAKKAFDHPLLDSFTLYNATTHDATLVSPSQYVMGNAEQWSTSPLQGALRPDAAAGSEKIILFWREDKCPGDLANAWLDHERKLAGRLPHIFYGNLHFTLVSALAGYQLQFGFCDGMTGKVTRCQDIYDLRRPVDIIRAFGVTVQIYRLMRLMREQAPRMANMVIMGVDIERPQHTTIYVAKNGVRKEIHNFQASYQATFGVELKYIQCLYLPQLRSAVPEIVSRVYKDNKKRQWKRGLQQDDTDGSCIYQLELSATSLGLQVDASTLTIVEMPKFMLCSLRAMAVLHAADLVHRDIRPQNALGCEHLLPNGLLVKYYKIIDLELVHLKDQAPTTTMVDRMRAWDANTLEAGLYTSRSDVRSMAKVLSEWVSSDPEHKQSLGEAGQDFLCRLAAGKAAAKLVQHEWLASARDALPEDLRPTADDVTAITRGRKKRAARLAESAAKRAKNCETGYEMWKAHHQLQGLQTKAFNQSADKLMWEAKAAEIKKRLEEEAQAARDASIAAGNVAL